jgi:hypothetical protein
MTSHSDPGDQERGTRRKPRPAAPLTAPGQIDAFRDTQPPKGPSEGEERKERALERHEKSSRAPLIRYLRTELRALLRKRDSLRQGLAFFNDPVGTIDGKVFVTADDAVRILKESRNRGTGSARSSASPAGCSPARRSRASGPRPTAAMCALGAGSRSDQKRPER